MAGCGWAAVADAAFDAADAAATAGWEDVVAAAGARPTAAGWAEVVEGALSDAETSQAAGVAAEASSVIGVSALVPLGAEARNVAVLAGAVFADMRDLIAGPDADPLAVGRWCAQIGQLQDASWRGKRLFDTTTQRIADDALACPHFRSCAAAAHALRADPKKVAATRVRLGAACYQVERYALVQMIDNVTASIRSQGGECITFSSFVRYDETPLLVRTSCEGDDVAVVHAGCLPSRGRGARVTYASPSKLVQFEWRGSMLLKTSDSEFLFLEFQLPTYVSVVDRTTSEVYRFLCSRVEPPLQSLLGRFARRQRSSTTDGAHPIHKAEKCLATDNPTVHCMHLTCDVHKIATIAKRGTSFAGAQVSAMLAIALSLRHGGAMRTFRRVLRKLLADRVVVLRGEPSRAATVHRLAVLRLFCQHDDTKPWTIYQHSVLSMLANGDYRNSERVEHYCRGCCASKADTLSKFATAFTDSVCRRGPPVFPRSRWTKADEACQWLCLLACMHNLLAQVYVRWAVLQGSKVQPAPAEQDDFGSHHAAITDEGGLAQGDHLPGASAVEGEPGDSHLPLAHDPAAAWREEQSTYRSAALSFLADKDSTAKLAILTTVLLPQQALMRQALDMAGDEWEHVEFAKTSLAAHDGVAYQRRLRACVVAKGLMEEVYMSRLKSLLANIDSWDALPPWAHTRVFTSMAFRLICACGGLCFELLVAPRRSYPWKTFNLASGVDDGSSLSDVLLAEAPCRFDSWTRAFVSHYKDRLDSIEAKLDLWTTASMVRSETAQIEAQHASIRRSIHLSSTHTHQQHVERASSDFILRHVQMRSRARDALQRNLVANVSPVDPALDEPPQKKFRTRGGGAFRAFIHSRCAGVRKPDFADLAREYRQLSPVEKATFKELGEEGCSNHRRGLPSFGPSTRQAKQARQRHLREQAVGAARSEAKTSLLHATTHVLAVGDDTRDLFPQAVTSQALRVGCWEDHMLRTRAVVRAAALRRAALRDAHSEAIVSWHEKYDTTNALAQIHSFVSTPCLAANSWLSVVSNVPRLRQWKWQMIDSASVASKALSLRGELVAGAALRDALDKDWSATHSMVCHADLERIDRVPVESVCRRSGMCLCSPAGKVIRYMWERFRGATLHLFPAASSQRDMLVNAYIGYNIVGKLARGAVGAEDGLADAAEEAGDNTRGSSVFLYVPVHYVSPWRPTFASMEVCNTVGERVVCRSSFRFRTHLEALAGLDADLRWSVIPYKLLDGASPVASFLPCEQEFMPLSKEGCMEFWRGTADKARARRKIYKGQAGDVDCLLMEPPIEDDQPDDDSSGSVSASSDTDESEESESSPDGSADDSTTASSSSSSSPSSEMAGEHPPAVEEVPIAPLLAAVPREGRQPATCVYRMPHGVIRYYATTLRFAAQCAAATHGNCRRERKVTAAPGKGRPLGFLAAWLEAGPAHANQEEHLHIATFIPLEQRREARARLLADPSARELLEYELPPALGEDLEPTV